MTEDKCKVCGCSYILTETFCPECGFERHVLPETVSKEVEEYEKKRIEEYKERRKKQQEQTKEIEKLNSDLKTANDKSKASSKEIDRLKSELKSMSSDMAQNANEYKKSLSESAKKNEDLKRQIAQLESAAKVIESQRKDLVERLKITNESLEKEAEEHKKTKTELEQLKLTAQNTSSTQTLPQPHPISTPKQGRVVGKIIFLTGNQNIQDNVYDGSNNYAIPADINSPISGDAFRIESNNNIFRLYDLCGLTRKINGEKIGEKGLQLYNEDRFSVGKITIQIKLPKINFRDLLK